MQIEPLNLSHQKLLSMKFRSLNSFFSEYSFANLYLFRHLHQYELIHFQEEIFVKGVTRDKQSFIMLTTFPNHSCFSKLKSIIKHEFQFLYPISEEWIEMDLLKNSFSQKSFKEEDSDYLYGINKLAHYPGRHLDNKRNLVSQLLQHTEIRSEFLEIGNVNQISNLQHAHQILDKWKEDYPLDIHDTDYYSCLEAIEHFQDLQLHGRIIFVNQQAEGFTIGEWISNDCYVVHFSKANRTIKGLYQYLYQDLAQSIEGTCSWINLEQDLGIPALRQSKHSYQPDRLLVKWRVKLS